MAIEIPLEKQKELISEVFSRAKFENVKKAFRKTINNRYPHKKIVGIFGKNDSMLHAIDIGDMSCKDMIKKLSDDLAKTGKFIIITQFGIEDESGLSEYETKSLWNDLKESTTQSISHSICLASVVSSAIFILNKGEGSTVLHEVKEFHDNIEDILLSIGFLFYSEKPNCNMLEQKGEYTFSCKKIFEECLKNELKCDFHEHITMSNREPFIKARNSFLYLIRRYSDVVEIFTYHYKEMVK